MKTEGLNKIDELEQMEDEKKFISQDIFKRTLKGLQGRSEKMSYSRLNQSSESAD